MKSLPLFLLAATAMLATPVLAQEAANTNMEIFMQKVKADKKLLVANNMELSDAEAKGFWPVYDAYQKDLEQVNLRLGKVIKEYADAIAGWAEALSTVKLSAPPGWVQTLPLVGKRVAQAWEDLAASGQEELAKKLAPYAAGVVRWFVEQLGSFGMMAIQFLLTVVIAAILFATGETVAEGVRRFGRRLAGTQGENMVVLAGQAIRGIALGVVGTAFVQAALGGIGLAVTGMPFATILTAIMFLLCVAQIGPGPVLLVGVGWLYWTGSAGWATALLVWAIMVGTVDNVIRPILIKKGADLPLFLILTGVIGGLMAFGLVGIFIGPMLLAVSYRLLEAWVCEEPAEPAPPADAA